MLAEDLKTLVLTIISRPEAILQKNLDNLCFEDWCQILSWMRHHRIGPSLHVAFSRKNPALEIDADYREEFKKEYRRHGIRVLALQQELLCIDSVLVANRIPYRILKGPALAFSVYPEPGLRPMRDIDVLVPQQFALLAFKALQSSGFERIDKDQGHVEATIGIAKHLPSLLGKSKQFPVELHTKLFANDAVRVSDPTAECAYWAQGTTLNLAGRALCVDLPVNLLIHLIQHAVYEHNFNNGPLLLTDVYYLTQKETIDWNLFWNLAKAQGIVCGCSLVLGMVNRFFQTNLPTMSNDNDPAKRNVFPDEIFDAAVSLMLGDLNQRSALHSLVAFRLQSRWSRQLWVLLTRIFPSKRHIACLYPVHHDSLAVYFWYLVNWKRILLNRLPNLFKNAIDIDSRSKTDSLIILIRWLRLNSN